MAHIENELLAICIPTYNHADPLKKCLEAMIPQAKQYGIPIFICDNASTDHTLKVIKSFQKVYPLLEFKSNSKNLGVDQNMINAARMAHSKYAWVIGSRRILLPNTISKIYDILKEGELDLLVLNDLNSTFSVPQTQSYGSSARVFMELHRNLTGLGFQILPSEAWNSRVVEKYIGTEWTVVGVALEYLATKQTPRAYFVAEPCATSSGESHWKPRFFQIWENWKRTIQLLPSAYSKSEKEQVLRESVNYLFVKKFGIMDIRAKFTLIDLRAKHIYDSEVFERHREDLERYGGLPSSTAYLVAKLPIALIIVYYKTYDIAKKVARTFIHQSAPINPTPRRGGLPSF